MCVCVMGGGGGGALYLNEIVVWNNCIPNLCTLKDSESTSKLYALEENTRSTSAVLFFTKAKIGNSAKLGAKLGQTLATHQTCDQRLLAHSISILRS